MLVIVEGPDGSGKTTLAAEIIKELADEPNHVTVYQHACKPERDARLEYTEPLEGYRPGTGVSFVLDRWHLGEMVYGPLHRGGAGLTRSDFRDVEKFLDERGAVVVLCNGPTGVLAKRLRKRGEEPNTNHLRQEAHLFDITARTSELPVVQSPVGMEVPADQIVALARDREEERK